MIRLMWWSRRVTDGVTDGVTDVLTGGVTDSVTDGAFWLWRLMDGSVRRLLPAKRSVPVTKIAVEAGQDVCYTVNGDKDLQRHLASRNIYMWIPRASVGII